MFSEPVMDPNDADVYSYFEKGCGKKRAATIPEGNMGYDQYTVPDDCSCRSYLCCFLLALANTFPWPFVPILSNFFEKKENSKPHTMPFRIVASTFPDNLSRNSCIHGYSLLRPQTYLRSSLTRVLKLCRLKQIKSIDVDKV